MNYQKKKIQKIKRKWKYIKELTFSVFSSINEFKEIEIDENDSNSMDESEEDKIEGHDYNLLDMKVI